LHIPVPIQRADDAYFAPLENLRPAGDIYLGLVHGRDGIQGALSRAKAASKFLPSFGIATECGLNQRPEDEVLQLIRLHADIWRELAAGLG
jgi:hypothetical protein